MAKKMYYTQEEASEKLGVTPADLQGYVQQGKLRVFQDGAKNMFRTDEIDALAGAGEEEIELAPADTSTEDVISLADTGEPAPPGKEDTVITAEGISIFDDEDLEIEEADPMAKTQVAPPLEDQLSSDSVGGGSGLLDLTRESDDTSLGAEILDHIDMEGAIGSSIAASVEPEPEEHEARAAIAAAPVSVEAIDPTAGLFCGFIVGAAIVALLMGVVALAAMMGVLPGYLQAMQENLLMVAVGTVVVVGLSALGGFLIGKSAAARELALRQVGSQT
jgi:hypothetical protein